MFSKVIAEAKEYTRPVVTIYKFAEGQVLSSVATYIHIDELGHILSANHIFTVGSEYPIEASVVIFDGQYQQAEYIAQDKINDLVLLRIKDYKPGSIKVFPRFFRMENELPQRTQLARLGYPNSNVDATWDESKKCFNWVNGKFNYFDNSGILLGYEIDHENKIHLLDTNFPAKIGQSGGPVLTAQGVIAGIQSKNSVFENPGNRNLEIGVAASHVAIARLLEKHSNIKPIWA